MKRAMLIAAALIAFAAAPNSALAQFYKGKTITMIVNYPPGGPTDIEGRIVAQHLPDHIPGHPNVVVKNIGGAAGLIGANQLGDATPNGDTIGFFTMEMISQVIGNPAIHTRLSDFALVAGVESPLVVYMRKDTPPGVNVATDVMKTKDFKALTLNAQNFNTINLALTLDLLGIKYQPVPAYIGSEGSRDGDPAECRTDGRYIAVRLDGLGRAVDGEHRHSVVAIVAARQGRQLPAQPRSAQHADIRGVLRERDRRQAASR